MSNQALISTRKESRILLAGGGTGGHVYPAIAIANAIMKRRPDTVISFAGSPDRIEWRLVPEAGYAIHPITVQGLQRKLSLRNLMLPLKVVRGIKESSDLIKQFDADVVVGTGGYVALPLLVAARYLVRPTLIQEQNAFMGLTNRIACRFADRVHLAFEEARPKGGRDNIRVTGNPVRSELTLPDRDEGRAHFGLSHTKQVLFVFGGSLGSQAINEAMAEQLTGLLAHDGLGIIWQTGAHYFDRYEQAIHSHPRIKLCKYIDRMDMAYAAADLTVCRSGALTCSELMLTGNPSILIPSPNVAEDHQTKNAKSLERGGAAILIAERDMRQDLLQRIRALLQSENRLNEMAVAARGMSRPDAAERIADDVLFLAERRLR